jgi:branched-chain amino acid transport system ATP-binding protein
VNAVSNLVGGHFLHGGIALNEAILKTADLRKEFGGVVAVMDVSFEAGKEEILTIIGPNGAGKTTLFNLISGVHPLTGGEIYFKGRRLNGLEPHAISSLGIARTFQNVQLFGNMTVLENVMVGRHHRSSYGLLAAALRLPRARVEEQEIIAKAREYLSMVGLAERADLNAMSLPFGQQRMLEIARAMATEPEIILLDEPGAGLNTPEKEELARLVEQIRQGGVTVLLVEHDMEFVMGIADRIIVLDYGEKIAEGTPAEVQNNPRVIAAYLGEEDVAFLRP